MIVLHVAANRWYVAPITSFEWNTLNAYDSIVRFCVPVFIMISGVLYLDETREISLKEIIMVKIRKLFVVFVFWSFAYASLTRLYAFKTVNFEVIEEILHATFLGHYHIWFLPMLMGLYLIVPFLREITKDKRLTEYFLILSFIFAFLLNFLEIIPYSQKWIQSISNLGQVHLVLGYSGYFVLGYYLDKYNVNNKLIYLFGILSISFTAMGTMIVSFLSGQATPVLYTYLLPNTLFSSSMIFILFKNVLKNSSVDRWLNKKVIILSELSLGIYLVHDFFNILFGKFNINTAMFNPIIAVPIISLLVFVLSFFSALIIKRMYFMKKLV
jgi:surface polysaccharide O-acyltransferase-like enzyme